MKKLRFKTHKIWYPIQVKDLNSGKVLAGNLSQRNPSEELLITEDQLHLEFRQGLFKKTQLQLDLRSYADPIIRLSSPPLNFLIHRWVLPIYVILAFVPRFIFSEENYLLYAQYAYLPLSLCGLAIILYLIWEYTIGRTKQVLVSVEEYEGEAG